MLRIVPVNTVDGVTSTYLGHVTSTCLGQSFVDYSI